MKNSSTTTDISKYLEEWYKLQQQLKQVKEDEMELRKYIFETLFPNPVVGVNTANIGHGYELRATVKLNYTVDKAALISASDTFDGADIDPVKLIKYKPELSLTEYNKLTNEQRRLFDYCLVTKPGSPTMEIVKAK